MQNVKWVVVFGVILIIGCAKQEEVEKQVEVISVVTAKPYISDIVSQTTLPGTILPIKEAEISSKMPGKLQEILVEENTAVQKGQIVARLDPTDIQLARAQAEAALQTARAGLLQAEANHNQAKIEFERAKRLKETSAISESAFDKAKTAFELSSAQFEMAKSQVNQAEVGLATVEQHLSDTNVPSPMSGIITSKMANEGEKVDKPILKVMDISRVKLEVTCSEDLITKIKRGREVKVNLDAYPNQNFIGTIKDISPTVNPQSRTFDVTISISNPRYLIKPGMFARAVIDLDRHKDTLCVPQGAIFNRGLDNYLYVVSGNKAKLKQVKPGLKDLEKIEVTAGLSLNEEVVIRGVENLQDGVLVEVRR